MYFFDCSRYCRGIWCPWQDFWQLFWASSTGRGRSSLALVGGVRFRQIWFWQKHSLGISWKKMSWLHEGHFTWSGFTSNKDWEQVRGAKIATIFQDPMTSLDPIKTIGSQITEVIVTKRKTAQLILRLYAMLVSRMLRDVLLIHSSILEWMRQRIVIAIKLCLSSRHSYLWWADNSSLMWPFKHRSLTCWNHFNTNTTYNNLHHYDLGVV